MNSIENENVDNSIEYVEITKEYIEITKECIDEQNTDSTTNSSINPTSNTILTKQINISKQVENSIKNFEEIICNFFMNVIFNWNNISQNPHVMNVVNMNDNILCQKLKSENPSMKDSFIQAHVVTILILMYILMSIPIKNPFDDSDRSITNHLNNYSILFNKTQNNNDL